ncbi:MAG: transporter ATP-binding protein [Ilumatobacteraceae bacterium]|nr:transporter ATP-binding protein [Ilumatobacteraceae bacterium]
MSLDADIQVQLGTLNLQVELSVKQGEVLAILGPNGAGKSTLMRALAGLIAIDAGRISIDEIVLDDVDAGVFVPAEKRPIGVVFQDYLLFAHLTAVENVAFGLRARGVAKVEARQRAREWLQRVGLDDHASHRPRALSGGQAQRVALARALATDPRLLLLDEPLAALDAGTRSGVRRDLRRHLESFDGMRVLVTHDPVDAYALADRVAIMDAGRVVQVGTISEVAAHPRSRYVADLVGTNLVVGMVTDGVLTTDEGARVVVADAQSGRSFAVIRPQGIGLSRSMPSDTSVRNVWAGVVGDIDRLGDRVRVGVEGSLPLTAEITAAALDSLDLRPGDTVHTFVKATDIEAYLA